MFSSLWREDLHRSIPLALTISVIGHLSLPSAAAENLPYIRPAFVGSGPKALINLIDTQKLIKKGQGNAALMFTCNVEPDGRVSDRSSRLYRLTEGAETLKQEVKDQLYRCRFVPAVHNHKKTWAWFYGTVTFVVVNGKPRLRIFANQDPTELEKESDFVAPQSIYVIGHHYDHVYFPERAFATEDDPGVVELSLTVDASGKLTDIKLIKEVSTGEKFGEAAVKHMKTLRLTPAYRNGQITVSTSRMMFIYWPMNWKWKP